MADTKLIGILNVTPDSFSDGGKFIEKEAAISAISQMIAAGAVGIDIGAESTRPGAVPVSPQEEWRRLEPVMQAIPSLKKQGIIFSLDTRHADVAASALEYGVDWINDVTGFSLPAMVEAVRQRTCSLVVMHSLGVPANKAITLPPLADPVEALLLWAKERIAHLESQGITRNRIIFDPGLGFGKTPEQCLAIIRGVSKFSALGVRIMIGHSRKSFLAGLSPDRDETTLATSVYLALQGVDYLRVHEIPRHVAMLNVVTAITYDDRQSQHRRTA